MGGVYWQGIDYTAIEPVARMLGVPADADLFGALRACEGSALGVLNGR